MPVWIALRMFILRESEPDLQTKGVFLSREKEISSQSKHKKIIKIKSSRYWALLISVIAYSE